MLKRIVLLTSAVALCLAGGACTGKKTQAELNREKTAAFRAQQKQKAVRYYSELVKKFPDSVHANDAQARLQALGPAATPAKK